MSWRRSLQDWLIDPAGLARLDARPKQPRRPEASPREDSGLRDSHRRVALLVTDPAPEQSDG